MIIHSNRRSVRTVPILTLASLLCVAAIPCAETCPDEGVRPVPATDVAYHVTTCGTGIEVNSGPIRASVKAGACPAYSIATPAHNERMAKKGYFTKRVGTLGVKLITYQCNSRWFLFIPIGSHCQVKSAVNHGEVPDIAQIPCSIGLPQPTAGVR
ncbi:MAG: hypothetical protein KDC87_20585 [Planctomycetes bacterium]|nr:hypothetical protein [Planctomycetota bacterium]MCB9872036.1 hypothetical protein [Planctomycetota bacterium]MCB9888438.1 hypothetical protein [Planctomycetota bacterium]